MIFKYASQSEVLEEGYAQIDEELVTFLFYLIASTEEFRRRESLVFADILCVNRLIAAFMALTMIFFFFVSVR